MTKGKKKLFLDTEKLYTAMTLRRAGWGFEPISIIYECDRSSIRKQARKYIILPEVKYFYPQKIALHIVTELNLIDTKTEWADIQGERVCLGKSYADYIKDGR
jgi:hypothetical protein